MTDTNVKKYLDLTGLISYDEKIKELIDSKDTAAFQNAKNYADGLADNYDPAGTAQTKVNELATGAVATNTAAITKLNGADTVEGSVAKQIKDTKALIDTNIDAVEAKADAAQTDADAAQADIDALEVNVGNVDTLSTTNKTVVGAINEVLTAVGAGGTNAAVTIDTTTTTEGALKSYTIKQGNTAVGVIDIPKDMVVESGSVVVDPEGQVAGTYIKLVLANVEDPLYINVASLVDVYTAQADATQIQVVVSADRKISASIVAGSINTMQLASNAVITNKIADANVTKEKLSTAVQNSLDKADVAAPQTALDAVVERVTSVEGKVEDGFASITTTEIETLFTA